MLYTHWVCWKRSLMPMIRVSGWKWNMEGVKNNMDYETFERYYIADKAFELRNLIDDSGFALEKYDKEKLLRLKDALYDLFDFCAYKS